jgi:hypothetical protein
MKKVMICLVVLATLVPTLGNAAASHAPVVPISTGTEPIEVRLMLNRLETINAMDKSKLKATERKALRKEVRLLKKDLKASGGGVYLSVGALILIILLLIVLL